MQISNFGGIPVLNSNLQTNTAKTLQNIPAPKFVNYLGGRDLPNHVLTKTEATRSDEEILNDVRELAENIVQQFKFKGTIPAQLPASIQKEWNRLSGEFVAPYSPDRKAIFTQGLESTQKEIKSRISKPMLDTSLITILFGKNRVDTSIWFAPNDKRVIEIDNMSFFDENGKRIGGYHHGIWGVELTEAENARSRIFHAAYGEALSVAALAHNMTFEGGDEEFHATRRTQYHTQIQAYQATQTNTTQTTTAQQAASRYEQMQFAEHKG